MTTRTHRNKQQPTLRLTRDDGDAPAPRVEVATTFRSTGTGRAARSARARTRLVAGTVDLPATPDEDSSGVGAVIGRIGPDEFLRGLESTLEQAQRKLDELKRDVEDDAFKFPGALARDDDHGPRPRAA